MLNRFLKNLKSNPNMTHAEFCGIDCGLFGDAPRARPMIASAIDRNVSRPPKSARQTIDFNSFEMLGSLLKHIFPSDMEQLSIAGIKLLITRLENQPFDEGDASSLATRNTVIFLCAFLVRDNATLIRLLSSQPRLPKCLFMKIYAEEVDRPRSRPSSVDFYSQMIKSGLVVELPGVNINDQPLLRFLIFNFSWKHATTWPTDSTCAEFQRARACFQLRALLSHPDLDEWLCDIQNLKAIKHWPIVNMFDPEVAEDFVRKWEPHLMQFNRSYKNIIAGSTGDFLLNHFSDWFLRLYRVYNVDFNGIIAALIETALLPSLRAGLMWHWPFAASRNGFFRTLIEKCSVEMRCKLFLVLLEGRSVAEPMVAELDRVVLVPVFHYRELVYSLVKRTLTLQSLCRRAVLRPLPLGLLTRSRLIESLDYPEQLKAYLRFEEFNNEPHKKAKFAFNHYLQMDNFFRN